MEVNSDRKKNKANLITVSESPLCQEADFTAMDSVVTPTDDFYVRSHFASVPDINESSWRLKIKGKTARSIELTLEDLRSMPSRELMATMECAGNSRVHVNPPAEGLRFGHGAISTARWRGVSLSEVLTKAGLLETAKEVVFKGADSGQETDDGVSFNLNYTRSLPLDKALDPDTLLVYEMNGDQLTPSHGYPLRLLVPSWYGMASVKWLMEIEVSDKAFDGFFQSRRYVMVNQGMDVTEQKDPVTTVKVKCLINTPAQGQIVKGQIVNIAGLAWSGEGSIEKVEVSCDDGLTWCDADLGDNNGPHAWRKWAIACEPGTTGHFLLMARATDSNGNTQPKNIPWNYRGYANNAIHSLSIQVEAE